MHIQDKNIRQVDFLKSKISPNDTILLHGGGNFGDLYRHHVLLRNFLISTFAQQNKILIFPQTINYRNVTLAASDNKIYSNASDLTIMARSDESFEFASKTFPNVNLILVPDAAFMIGDLEPAAQPDVDILVLRRTDFEHQYITKRWKEVFDKIIGNKSSITYLVSFFFSFLSRIKS